MVTTRTSRAAATLLLIGLLLGTGMWAAQTSASLLRQDDATTVEIGAGPVSEPSLHVVGRTVYRPDGVDLFGYLTEAIGLDSPTLFTGPTPSAESARLTYVGQVANPTASVSGDVTAIAGDGVLRVYFDDDAGASWEDPASFDDGIPVAEFSLQLRDSMQRQAPDVGVVVGDERLTQKTGDPFSLDGQTYQFGQTGIEQRLRLVGALMTGASPGQPLPVGVTGFASVTKRPSRPVRLGVSATPAVAASAAASPAALDCSLVAPWLSATTSGLDRAQALTAAATTTGDIASLDAAALRQTADQLSGMAAAQRETNPPGAATGANQLVVTALSTYARGLQTIATAASQGDVDLLAQGRSALADGEQLLARARTAVNDIGASCSVSATTVASS
jgi:hypothetical protein